MHSISNKKINQVTDQTLVVGMDIAKKKHYACFVDERGRVLKSRFPFCNREKDWNGCTSASWKP